MALPHKERITAVVEMTCACQSTSDNTKPLRTKPELRNRPRSMKNLALSEEEGSGKPLLLTC